MRYNMLHVAGCKRASCTCILALAADDTAFSSTSWARFNPVSVTSQSTDGVIAHRDPEHDFISGSDEALLVSIEMPPDKRNELIAQLP
jgi:hypothetical protein